MTAKRNPREILAQLISLRNNAGTSLYTRLKMADELLSNREWVEDPSGGGGDASRAIDRIEQDCFGPESGMSLPEMLEVLKAVPQESVWKQNRYNLKKMRTEMKEREGASRPTQHARTKETTTPPSGKESPGQDSDHDEVSVKHLLEANKELKAQVKEYLSKIHEQDREIQKLRKSIKRMKDVLKDLQTV